MNDQLETRGVKRELFFFLAIGLFLYGALFLLWNFSPSQTSDLSQKEPEKTAVEQSTISRLAFFLGTFNR